MDTDEDIASTAQRELGVSNQLGDLGLRTVSAGSMSSVVHLLTLFLGFA